MILPAISLLMAMRDSLTLTMRLPPIVETTVTLPPQDKSQVFQMCADLRVSANLTDRIFFAHSGQC